MTKLAPVKMKKNLYSPHNTTPGLLFLTQKQKMVMSAKKVIDARRGSTEDQTTNSSGDENEIKYVDFENIHSLS